ncbi:MAG: NUDIX hydrolase [Nitriliruptoraceae bacterium]
MNSEAAWFETLKQNVVYEGYSTVRVDEVLTPDGVIVEREIVVRQDAAAVVAVTPDDQIILVRQYRHAVESYMLEIPAGKVDVEGETVREAVVRELQEEALYTVDELHHLTTFQNSIGWTNERTYLFYAPQAKPTPPPLYFRAEAEEAHMEIVLLDFDEAVAAVEMQVIRDAKTALGILLAQKFRNRTVTSAVTT